jgi:hypothetical protein
VSQLPDSANQPPEKQESHLDATVAGASGGTLLAALAQLLPEHHPLKPILVIAAPAASVGLRAAWIAARRLARILERARF